MELWSVGFRIKAKQKEVGIGSQVCDLCASKMKLDKERIRMGLKEGSIVRLWKWRQREGNKVPNLWDSM